MPRTDLDGTTVLLTGATGGIGHAIARALAGRGARLILTGRRVDVLDGLAAEIDGRSVACDLSDRADVERLATEAVAAQAGVLVANAALPASGVFADLSQEQIDRMLEVNLRAPVALAHALTPAMVARGGGHMVFISSLAGKTASPASSLYSATKFGLRGFALGLREDLRGQDIGVSTVFPGFIRDAGMFADTGLSLPRGVGTRTPHDVATAVLRAIDSDRAELDVAPLALRVGSAFGGLAPQLAATVSRRLGSHDIASAMAERQRDQR
ncbi:MAG: SDR family NAD(P)-dependent oxidoreductase [Actinomycetota bacterium]|nr:SDR family NAD(P)-dependent oxidoreductase [Actinomycetota bacterium]